MNFKYFQVLLFDFFMIAKVKTVTAGEAKQINTIREWNYKIYRNPFMRTWKDYLRTLYL